VRCGRGRCTVVSVVGFFGSAVDDVRSHRGDPFQGDNTSMQPWKVQIRTTDCQDVIYSEGVTEDNVKQIAGSMEPGPYEFKMSWVSRHLADGWWPTIAPSVVEFRPAE
ncbi:MAG TPA: hypothetical protein K8V32_03765, partial [Enteractinococcus helveticum]